MNIRNINWKYVIISNYTFANIHIDAHSLLADKIIYWIDINSEISIRWEISQ